MQHTLDFYILTVVPLCPPNSGNKVHNRGLLYANFFTIALILLLAHDRASTYEQHRLLFSVCSWHLSSPFYLVWRSINIIFLKRRIFELCVQETSTKLLAKEAPSLEGVGLQNCVAFSIDGCKLGMGGEVRCLKFWFEEGIRKGQVHVVLIFSDGCFSFPTKIIKNDIFSFSAALLHIFQFTLLSFRMGVSES